MRGFVLSQWKYALVAVAAFLIGSAAVVSAAGPIKLFALSDESGVRVAEVTAGGELLVNTMGSDVAVTNFPAVHQVEGTVEVSNLPVDGDGRVIIAPFQSPQPQLFTLFDNVTVNPLDDLFSPFINVEGFSQYKLFARREGPAAVAAANIEIFINQSLDGILNDGSLPGTGVSLGFEGHLPLGTTTSKKPLRYLQANARWQNLGGKTRLHFHHRLLASS